MLLQGCIVTKLWLMPPLLHGIIKHMHAMAERVPCAREGGWGCVMCVLCRLQGSWWESGCGADNWEALAAEVIARLLLVVLCSCLLMQHVT